MLTHVKDRFGRFIRNNKVYSCYCCGSIKTYLNDGKYELWYHNYDENTNVLCSNCYRRLILNPRWYSDTRSRKLQYKSRRIMVKRAIRIGVCNWCRAVVGMDCKTTHMHHESYHDEDPLMGTIELCAKCHYSTRIINKLGQLT